MKKSLITILLILFYVLSIFFMTTGLTGCTEGGMCNMTSCNTTSCGNGCGNTDSDSSSDSSSSQETTADF